jgi:hypothetical protein
MTTVTDELPRRPRRKLVTPLTALLTAVLLAACGFIGGVQVQKHHGSSGAGAANGFAAARAQFGGGTARGGAAGGTGGGATGGGGFGGGGESNATVGSVANVSGKSFYVTDSSGNTVKVKTNDQSKVTRTAVSDAGDIHPGDTVIVQGTKSSSGTVTATSVTATAKNATSGIAGLFGGGRGGFGGGAGATNQQGSNNG